MRLRSNNEGGYVLIRPLAQESNVTLNGFQLRFDQAYEGQHGDILGVGSSNKRRLYQISTDTEDNIDKEAVSAKKRDITMDSTNGKINPDESSFAQEVTSWEHLENGQLYMMITEGVRPREKVAAYDIDGTIIKTKSGRVFAAHLDDWQLAYPEVPGKLKDLFRSGFKIVFMTNQSGMTTGKLNPQDFKTKLKRIIAKLNIPIQVLVAPGVSKFRKPMTGVWEYLEEKANGGLPIDRSRSFYVGDAAGRPARGSIKKDHSCCDRLMALNLGVPFFTPEEHFQNAKTITNWIRPEFMPQQLTKDSSKLIPDTAILKAPHQEVIVMVGFPGSGKSFFTRENYPPHTNYVIVNRDKLGSWQKCVQEAERNLKLDKSVIIDNTSPDEESRKRYLDVGKRVNVPVRCFVMTTTYRHCKHNIRFRELTDPSHIKINDMVLNSFK